MTTGPGRRALSFLYLVPYTALAAGLVLVGYAVDRAPLLPASASGRYQRWTLASLGRLARPIDGLTDQSPEPVAGGVAGESAP